MRSLVLILNTVAAVMSCTIANPQQQQFLRRTNIRRHLQNNNDNDVLDVACYARDTVDMFIQERDDLNLNNKELEILIDNDVLMTTEKNKQIIIAKYLKENQLINRISLDEVRSLNYGSIIDVNIFKD